MAIKFGVNGCGRIGRSILRAPYIKAAATGPMKGVLSFTDQPLVKVCAWYDHEWGFSNRMLDTTPACAKAT